MPGISGLIYLVIALLVLALVIYLVNVIMGMIPLPPVAKTLAYVLIGLLFLFWLLQTLGLAIH